MSRITGIRFGLLSADEIRRIGTVTVNKDVILEKFAPKTGGVNDLRMGTIDKRYRCKTCDKNLKGCVGHPGHLPLASPVYHVCFIPIVVKILSCVCHFCCTSLLSADNDSAANKKQSTEGQTSHNLPNQTKTKQQKSKLIKNNRAKTEDEEEKEEEDDELDVMTNDEEDEEEEEDEEDEEDDDDDDELIIIPDDVEDDEDEFINTGEEDPNDDDDNINNEEDEDEEDDEEEDEDENAVSAVACIDDATDDEIIIEPNLVSLKKTNTTNNIKCFQKLVKSKKAFICPNPKCGGPQPRYSAVLSGHDIGIKIDWKETLVKYQKRMAKLSSSSACTNLSTEQRIQYIQELAKKPFTAADAATILGGIDANTCHQMGFDENFAHPKNMIITDLLIPPPIIRPAAMTSDGRPRNHDDATEKLKKIVTSNENVKTLLTSMGKNMAFIQGGSLQKDKLTCNSVLNAVKDLQYNIATLFNNDIRGIKTDRQRSGAATKSISARLKGKEGRFRNNVLGKRVDYAVRSVITPDPNLDLDEVGVPIHAACTVTIPEKVTRWNIKQMREHLLHGANSAKGARNIKRADGKVIDLLYVHDRERLKLSFGDEVQRYLKNGDLVIFNRQPSLHKQSMMAHRVFITPNKTFNLNTIVCAPYNADFDGKAFVHSLPSTGGLKRLLPPSCFLF